MIREHPGKFMVAAEAEISELRQELQHAKDTITVLRSEQEEQNRRAKTVFESVMEGIIVFNANGECVYANLAALNILGYANDMQVGTLSFSEILGGVGKKNDLFGRLRERETLRNEPITLRRSDGKLIYVLSSVFAVRAEDSRFSQIYFMFVDIIDLRIEEEKRLKKLASFPELNPTPIIEMDLLGKIQYCNSIARKNFPDLAQKGINHPYLAGCQELLGSVDTKKGNLVRREINIKGEWFGQSIQYVPENKTIRIYGANITQRKKAEDDLKASEEKFRNLVENAPIGISMVTPDGKRIERNLAAQKMHGYESREEFLSLSGTEFYFDSADRKRFMDLVQRGPVRDFEVRRKRKDGSIFWVSLSAIPYIDSSGERQIIIITQDITERKRIEEQLITTSRLATIGELASGVAHEINNPLTSVIGFSELLMEGPLPEEIRADLVIIRNEAQRAAHVVKNLLTFARKGPDAKRSININDVISKVLELRAYEQKVNNIKITACFSPNLPEVIVDSFQLQQVFFNLIINAEYFMIEAHKKGSLTITTENTGAFVRASIMDDGPGIPAENLKHLFNPFFTTKPIGKGTGLGLSICHGIVTAHGGNIFVESNPDQGCTFTVELPIDNH